MIKIIHDLENTKLRQAFVKYKRRFYVVAEMDDDVLILKANKEFVVKKTESVKRGAKASFEEVLENFDKFIGG